MTPQHPQRRQSDLRRRPAAPQVAAVRKRTRLFLPVWCLQVGFRAAFALTMSLALVLLVAALSLGHWGKGEA